MIGVSVKGWDCVTCEPDSLLRSRASVTRVTSILSLGHRCHCEIAFLWTRVFDRFPSFNESLHQSRALRSLISFPPLKLAFANRRFVFFGQSIARLWSICDCLNSQLPGRSSLFFLFSFVTLSTGSDFLKGDASPGHPFSVQSFSKPPTTTQGLN